MADIGIIKFELAHMDFCMYAEHILEIVRYTGSRRIPCPLPYVVGLFELRHHIVTVVDLHKRVGLPSLPLTKDTVMIVTTLSSGTFGILVDNISDFRRVPEERILPPISIAGIPEHLLHGVLTHADDILPIPNFNKMFSSFMHVHLVPINFSEKIAFKYRFTPGSLTQTLEQNLLAQQTLDYDIVKKLPRSLYLPSTKVHRMTTYYADFSPQHRSKGEQSLRFRKVTRAGDEKYASLSQELKAQQQRTDRKPQQTANRHDDAPLTPTIDIDNAAAPTIALEQMLHYGLPNQPEAAFRPYREHPEHVRIHSSVGRPLARKLGMTPVRVAGYFSYYHAERPLKTQAQPTETASQTSPDAWRSCLQQPEGKGSSLDALLKTLRHLHQTQRTLSQAMLAELCAEYQVTPLKLARILSFFPEYSVPIVLDSSPDSEHSEPEIQEQSHALEDSTKSRQAAPHVDPTGSHVTDNLWQLADQHVLFDEQALRDVASRRGMPTCRLSKLQRFYW